MTPYFADTAYFVAVLNPKDALAGKAAGYAKSATLRMVTTEYVWVEVANFFSKAGARELFVSLVGELRASPSILIVPATSDLFDRGLALFAGRPDKDWSLTDCISFVVMTDAGLTDALTADHHFTQAGFTPLLA